MYNAYLDYFVRQAMQSQFGAPQPTNVNSDMIRPLLQQASVVVLFLLPMVTMRTYSEEKRSGTIELLLTSPITDLEITLGKFFGAMAMYLGFMGVVFAYILVLFGLGAGFGAWFYVGVGAAALILAYEHRLVRPGDLSRLDAAFFTMNGIMSLTVFGFALVDRLV